MYTSQQLWLACYQGRNDEAKRLINEGADVECRNGDGDTPLAWAALFGHTDIVRLFLEHGANVNTKNHSGRTAMHRATSAYSGNNAVSRLLIEGGADLHAKDDDNSTPLDCAKRRNKSSIAIIIGVAIISTKVIYTTSEDLRQNKITFKEFNNNIIILTDNDIPAGFEFEGHPTFTLQNIQQCIDQLSPTTTTENEVDIPPPDAIHTILAQRHPAITQRLQHWGMNLLHLIAYLPRAHSNDTQDAIISSLLTKYPQGAVTAVDIHGMTPLHHATINLFQKKISQECHDLLLTHSPPIVVHRAIEAGTSWQYLYPIVMAKMDDALTLEDEVESGLVPFMLAATRCDNDHVDGMLGSLSMVYELLCLKPDVMKEYDESVMMSKRVYALDKSGNSNEHDTKRRRRL